MTVGLLSFASTPAASRFVINLVYDNSQVAWSSTPAWYQTGVVTAANLIMAAFPNTNITFNCEIGYQFWYGSVLGNGSPVGASSSVGDTVAGQSLTYSTIRAGLAAVPNPTASLTAMLANTPAGSTLNGQGGSASLFTPNATCKALGIGGLSPTDPAIDGAVGIGTGWGSDKIVGVFLHEITHAMGRSAGRNPFNFTRFTSAGVRDFSSNADTSYFSLDGGVTKLADYDNTQDGGDFLNSGVQDTGGNTDSFDAVQGTSPIETLTAVDIQLMNAMGFQ